ncbi:MAG: dTMP kinase [bacterium]|nr:dTMP kinase [bacterium]
MEGHFVVIDGPDGAGKGTQIGMLKDTLSHRYGRPAEDFVFTREPGGSPFAEKIRKLILSPEAKEASASVMVQLFGAARFDHLEQTIIPALEAGKVVVSDRFEAATYAYQLFGQDGDRAERNLFAAQRTEIERLLGYADKPWTTIILDIDAETGKERAKKRRGQSANHLDERPLIFYRAVRNGFRAYAETVPNTTIIDASRTPALVHQDIIAVFDSILGGPSPLS